MSKRIVVKIGSSSLTSEQGGLNRNQVKFFADELASLHAEGHQVLLVTSGAIAAGFRRLGYATRPKLVHEKQAAAAVGQALLMQAYQEALGASGIAAAQILLTRPDFSNRGRAQNATRTIEELLKQQAIPIINENDTVAVDEINFGENESLSALVANLVKADGLYILTDMDGLYTGDPRKMPEAVRIESVDTLFDKPRQGCIRRAAPQRPQGRGDDGKSQENAGRPDEGDQPGPRRQDADEDQCRGQDERGHQRSSDNGAQQQHGTPSRAHTLKQFGDRLIRQIHRHAALIDTRLSANSSSNTAAMPASSQPCSANSVRGWLVLSRSTSLPTKNGMLAGTRP